MQAEIATGGKKIEKTIGVIGLGNMGSRFAANLLKEGFSVAAYDVKVENIEKLQAQRIGSIIPKTSNAELARQSDIIFSILPTADSVKSAYLEGENPLIEGLGIGKTVVEMSSIDSKAMKEIYDKLSPKGCDVIDATINGVEENVERREIVIMIAGRKDIVDGKVKPILERVSKAVVHVDANIGSSKDLKTATSMVNAIQMMGISEVLAWLAKREVNTMALLDVMENSATSLHGHTETTKKLLDGNFKPRTSWMPKDVGFGLKEGEESGVPMPITAATQQLFMLARAQGLAGFEATGIARKIYEKIAGVRLSGKD